MKQLKKISLDGFDELSTLEAAQLLGGQDKKKDKDIVVGSDSTTVASDSTAVVIPTETKKNDTKQSVTVNVTSNKTNGTTYKAGYTWSNGNWTVGANVNYNSKNGTGFEFKTDYNF